MRTGTLVAALTAAGLAGGIAGGLLVQAPVAAPEPAPRDAALDKEVAALKARLDEMQASVLGGAKEAQALRAELEKEKKATAEARNRLAGLEAGGPRGVPAQWLAESPHEFAAGRLWGALLAEGGNLPERVKKAMDLRNKSEEDRWAATRDGLGLSGGQEEDLKAAIKERDDAIGKSLKVLTDNTTGDANNSTTVTVAMPDPEKMRDARKAYDDKVTSTLSADQAKKWREEGYEDSFRGGPNVVISSTTLAPVKNGMGGSGEGGK